MCVCVMKYNANAMIFLGLQTKIYSSKTSNDML